MGADAKPCSTCVQVLPLSAFSPDRRSASGVQARCKGCASRSARDRRAGRPAPTPPRVTEKRLAVCAVDGCERHTGLRRGWCNMHYNRWWRTGGTGPVGRLLGTGDDVTYRTVHSRLDRVRGSAKDQSCVDCGEQAAHWSYDGGSEREQATPEGWPYTTDLSCYSARCPTCHARRDHPSAPFCPSGHEMSGDNVAMYPGLKGVPWRSCRMCMRANAKRQAARRREANA